MMLVFKDTDVYAVLQRLSCLAKKNVVLINVCIVIGKKNQQRRKYERIKNISFAGRTRQMSENR